MRRMYVLILLALSANGQKLWYRREFMSVPLRQKIYQAFGDILLDLGDKSRIAIGVAARNVLDLSSREAGDHDFLRAIEVSSVSRGC